MCSSVPRSCFGISTVHRSLTSGSPHYARGSLSASCNLADKCGVQAALEEAWASAPALERPHEPHVLVDAVPHECYARMRLCRCRTASEAGRAVRSSLVCRDAAPWVGMAVLAGAPREPVRWSDCGTCLLLAVGDR